MLTTFVPPPSGPNDSMPRAYRTAPLPALAHGTLTTPPDQLSRSSDHVVGFVRYSTPSATTTTRPVPLALEYVKVSELAVIERVVLGAVPSVHVVAESRETVTERTPVSTWTRICGSSARRATVAGS